VPAVSNSGPLILFARIGRLGLIRTVFAEVFIPPAVRSEVVGQGEGRPGAAEVAAASWITTQDVGGSEVEPSLLAALDRGEAEAIVLAERLGSQMPLLLDDRRGRRIARDRGLRVVGSAGLLVLAKQRGAIPLIRATLDRLRLAGLYLDDGAYREVLAIADEVPAGTEAEEDGP